jgi:hypothetical protein
MQSTTNEVHVQLHIIHEKSQFYSHYGPLDRDTV